MNQAVDFLEIFSSELRRNLLGSFKLAKSFGPKSLKFRLNFRVLNLESEFRDPNNLFNKMLK